MATGGALSMRLGQIRRRLRLRAALEGAVVGGTLAAVALAAGVAIARAGGGAVAAREVAALLALGLGAGAGARAARRIPLARCARLADAALDGQDRLLSALALEAGPATPFSRALQTDAVRRAETLLPGVAVPARRPRGLPALAVATAMLAVAALVPASSRAARIAPPSPVVARRAPLPPGALDAEREAARAALAEATRLADARLAALAGELERTLRRIAEGTLSDGAALETLAALEARAAEAAESARREAAAAEAAARGLAETAETRPAGKALGEAAGAPDDDRARDALAASAAAHPAETAKGLAAAARNLAGTESEAGAGSDADAEGQPGARRLAREQSAPSAGPPAPAEQQADDSQRHLERLQRDLDQAASACRDGDPSCASRAAERGRDLERLERQGAARDGLQRIARSAQQLRTRIGRRELGPGEQDAQAMRSFGRAARGGDQPGSGGEDQAGAGAGLDGTGESGTGDGERSGAGKAGRDEGTGRGKGAGTGAASAALGVAAEEAAEDAPVEQAAGTGNGIGRLPGGPPLGPRATETAPARGSEAEVPLADGAGPSRAEVIGTAAGQGFASRGYAHAYADYAAAVEDALAATAVPEGKRYLVRRYFDLIRPRAPTRGPRHAP